MTYIIFPPSSTAQIRAQLNDADADSSAVLKLAQEGEDNWTLAVMPDGVSGQANTPVNDTFRCPGSPLCP